MNLIKSITKAIWFPILVIGIIAAISHIWWVAVAIVVAGMILTGYLVIKSVRDDNLKKKRNSIRFDWMAFFVSLIIVAAFIGVTYFIDQCSEDGYSNDYNYDDRDAVDYWDSRAR